MNNQETQLTINILEGAYGDIQKLKKLAVDSMIPGLTGNNFRQRTRSKSMSTKEKIKTMKIRSRLGRYLLIAYQLDQKELGKPRWIQIFEHFELMLRYIVGNMIKDGKFKFPKIWKWLGLVKFIREWIKGLIHLFRKPMPEEQG